MEGSCFSNQDLKGKDPHPWLSVVVPIYNAEKHLNACIRSALSQSFANFELILVDDGSQDGSPEICHRFAKNDQRIRYYRKENGGSFQARLFGTEKARGEYITFCDADDYYSSCNVFATIHAYVEEYHCSVLQFGYQKKYRHLSQRINTVKDKIFIEREEFLKQEYPKLICSFWDPSHLTPNVWNKIYHRRLLRDLPAWESAERAFWGDDLVMNLAALEHTSSVLFVPQTLYVYQQGSGGTASFRVQTMDDLDFIKRNQLTYLERREDKDTLEPILHSETAGWFFLWVRQATHQLDEQSVKKNVERVLHLPSFVAARCFYERHAKDDWTPALLLRKADSELYYMYAQQAEEREQTDIKKAVRSAAKRLYMSI